MESEDFSFPRINDTSSAYNIDSPPLWNLSPSSSPNPYHAKQNDSLGHKLIVRGQKKSFSCIDIGRKIIGLDDNVHEDKMDLLWEDFNDQLSSKNGSATEFRSWAKSLTVSKTNALVPTKNKPSTVVIVKVLKKLFSINNNLHGRQRKRVR
ncbi:hypothetical protein Lalb_Chr01g0010021 [Lupinus albus]|uniref:Uncharacterized protein n=1 Tax=Lupinus albus TaxID=3870 RepID=A0A6A4R4W0_LUPAL|nr:hypothetical protein Lalb_Chr01g0010021 [Lupinus albus]